MTNRYRLEGEYDFLQQWQGGQPTTGLSLTASFDEADLKAPLGEMLPAFIDVDALLNLEGLRGELLPLGAPFDVYRFRGLISDSDAASPLEQSSIELYTALVGPWMYVYGETTAPTHTADRFEYEIRALARTRPWSDANDDGVVDAADYTLLRDTQAFDAQMYQDWRNQYGEAMLDTAAMDAMFTAASSAAISVAPEPGSCLLILTAVPVLMHRRRS